MSDTSRSRDLVSSPGSYVLLWVLPVAVMLAAMFLSRPAKTAVWIGALVWMGAARLINARRCGRTHCFYTGPFFLLMTVPVFLHGLSIVPLGANGWSWLGSTIGLGVAGIWFVTERRWGKYCGHGP